MKKIALKPVKIPLPRDTNADVRMAVAKAEAAMAENNNLIESVLNNIDGGVTITQTGNVLHIS